MLGRFPMLRAAPAQSPGSLVWKAAWGFLRRRYMAFGVPAAAGALKL